MSEGGSSHELFLKTFIMLVLMVVNIQFINVLKMKGIHSISESTIYVLFGAVLFYQVAFSTFDRSRGRMYIRLIYRR